MVWSTKQSQRLKRLKRLNWLDALLWQQPRRQNVPLRSCKDLSSLPTRVHHLSRTSTLLPLLGYPIWIGDDARSILAGTTSTLSQHQFHGHGIAHASARLRQWPPHTTSFAAARRATRLSAISFDNITRLLVGRGAVAKYGCGRRLGRRRPPTSARLKCAWPISARTTSSFVAESTSRKRQSAHLAN